MDDALDLDAIEARAAAATEGPWEWREDSHDRLILAGPLKSPSPDDESAYPWMAVLSWAGLKEPKRPLTAKLSPADKAFIAAARTDVPALVAEVRRLRATITWMRTGEVPTEHTGAAVGRMHTFVQRDYTSGVPRDVTWREIDVDAGILR